MSFATDLTGFQRLYGVSCAVPSGRDYTMGFLVGYWLDELNAPEKDMALEGGFQVDIFLCTFHVSTGFVHFKKGLFPRSPTDVDGRLDTQYGLLCNYLLYYPHLIYSSKRIERNS